MSITKKQVEAITQEAQVYKALSFRGSSEVIFDFTTRAKKGKDALAWVVVWAHEVAFQRGISLSPVSEDAASEAARLLKGADSDDARSTAREDLKGNNINLF